MIKKHLIFDYITLCKPKVVLLMLLTSWVGMQLATPGLVPLKSFLYGTIGIALCASSAAIINHLVDRKIDSKMSRTQLRPIASGRVSPFSATMLALALGIFGVLILNYLVNTKVTILTFVTLIGYAFFYTLYLKRATPQNIVIGGLSGAMPPLLGWVVVSNEINAFGWLLVLIIYTWTPPHFWALAIYRKDDYAKAKIPMLPVTHGIKLTKLCIFLYSILLFAVTCFPYVVKMSGNFYFAFVLLLNFWFTYNSYKLYKSQDKFIEKKLSIKLFNDSIIYLLILFIVLLIDHACLNIN